MEEITINPYGTDFDDVCWRRNEDDFLMTFFAQSFAVIRRTSSDR